MRDIAQIATLPGTEPGHGMIYALCADGTLWRKSEHKYAKWEMVEGIPYEDEPQ